MAWTCGKQVREDAALCGGGTTAAQGLRGAVAVVLPTAANVDALQRRPLRTYIRKVHSMLEGSTRCTDVLGKGRSAESVKSRNFLLFTSNPMIWIEE